MSNQKIKIVIVDDNKQTLASLKEMLSYTGNFDIIFTAIHGEDYIQKMENLSPESQPQVVLMDLDMKVMNGIDAINIGKMRFPNTKYIVLTVLDDEDNLFAAIQAGANGYLLKDEKISVISDHIISLVNHESTPMSPMIARKTFELLSRMPSIENKMDDVYSQLSSREIDVLKLMMEGYNYKVIAEQLFISTNTVKKHIAHIYEKLHVTSKAQLMKLGLG